MSFPTNRPIKFRFFNPPGESFVEQYNYKGAVDELFEQDPMLIPSQFTGLFDKEGKELFEGDIIELDSNGFGEIKTGLITFKHSSFCVELINAGSTLNFIFLPHIGNFKIIGNCFENPELLEVKEE